MRLLDCISQSSELIHQFLAIQYQLLYIARNFFFRMALPTVVSWVSRFAAFCSSRVPNFNITIRTQSMSTHMLKICKSNISKCGLIPPALEGLLPLLSKQSCQEGACCEMVISLPTLQGTASCTRWRLDRILDIDYLSARSSADYILW